MYKAKINDKVYSVSEKNSVISVDDREFPADIIEYADGRFHVLLENKSYSAEIISTDRETKSCVVKVDNKLITVHLKDKYDELLEEIGIDASEGKKVNDIKAPMPGMVLQVMVENGQPIKKGDSIVVLEAMKMENILKSPADGIVKRIYVSRGDKVEKNQVMVNLD